MENDTTNLKVMGAYAVAVVTLAIVTLMGIAVVNGFKTTGLVDNATADLFIGGLVIFGTFIGVIVIALVGKIVIGLFKKGV